MATSGPSSMQLDDKTSADYYFDSYSHFGIHEEMLKDQVRTKAYMDAIMKNPHLFRDKIVLDIGCGTGILSLFCSKAGAKHVYGIECSGIAEMATQIVADNGYSDKVTIIKAKVEELTLPVDKVDIIVSEWMGYFLFYESMLDTVIYARDKWLVPGGLIFPDRATLSLCAIEDQEYKRDKLDFWSNVYGFNMSCMRPKAIAEPLVDVVESDQVCTDTFQVVEVNICTMKKEDAAFSVPFTLKAKRNDYIQGVVAYFDIFFDACHKPLSFSTSPWRRPTHWKQTVFYLEDDITAYRGEALTGVIHSKPNAKNPRDLDIALEYEFKGKESRCSRRMEYRMR